MIDSLPIARLLFQFEWERSQWDSECERDIATNASRDLPCKFLSPSGVTPSMYALHCNDCSWTYPSPPTRTMSRRGGPGRTSYSKSQPPLNHVNGAKPLVALTRGSFAYTGSRDTSKPPSAI